MLGLLFLLNIAGVANASIVEWRLRDVSFEDASTAAGFLLFDTAIAPSPGDSIAAPISYDIKRTAGFFPAFEYTPEVSRAVVGDDPNPFVLLFLNTPPTEPSQRGSLRFGFQMPLPSAGGVVPLTLASGINHNCVSTCAQTAEFSRLVFVEAWSGEIVGTIVPEPEFVLSLGSELQQPLQWPLCGIRTPNLRDARRRI